MTTTLPKIFAIAVVGGLVAAALWTSYLTRPAPGTLADLASITLLDTPRQLPEFLLVDQNAAPISHNDLRGKWRLLFFGFTHCPAVCPNTLSLLNSIVTDQTLADTELAVTLVTVDPERDTPERIRPYLKNFNDDFSGITGDAEQLRGLRKAMYIPLQRIELEQGYTLDHGSALILLNPEGEVAGFITTPHQRKAIVAELKKVFENH